MSRQWTDGWCKHACCAANGTRYRHPRHRLLRLRASEYATLCSWPWRQPSSPPVGRKRVVRRPFFLASRTFNTHRSTTTNRTGVRHLTDFTGNSSPRSGPNAQFVCSYEEYTCFVAADSRRSTGFPGTANCSRYSPPDQSHSLPYMARPHSRFPSGGTACEVFMRESPVLCFSLLLGKGMIPTHSTNLAVGFMRRAFHFSAVLLN
ncbi:hypothetical protein EXIGLDRAFT_337251 [Exidia glandulosa HHB12029]|uniref:Uncharacterized protein n=1 Tax=Exidia glandulosa HHB12029 TaxID=1314781 RepID=A0A165LIP1_EXIGL|nr:hypothetical protein EXIGLDRAFT_337251 [Exidia glandulosa HHB12029]